MVHLRRERGRHSYAGVNGGGSRQRLLDKPARRLGYAFPSLAFQ